MYAPVGVKTSTDYPIPDMMKAWVLGNPGELLLRDKPVPVPKRAEVLVRIDAVAICATDLEIIYYGPISLSRHGRTCSGHPRLACGDKDVDGRVKHGHDDGACIIALE